MARTVPCPLKYLPLLQPRLEFQLCKVPSVGLRPPARGHQALGAPKFFYPTPLFFFFLFLFFPTSGSPNPKLKVNRCCWLPSSIPCGSSQDLECQKAAAGGTGEACAWVMGGGGGGGRNKTQLHLACPFPNQRLFLIYAFAFRLKRAALRSDGSELAAALRTDAGFDFLFFFFLAKASRLAKPSWFSSFLLSRAVLPPAVVRRHHWCCGTRPGQGEMSFRGEVGMGPGR